MQAERGAEGAQLDEARGGQPRLQGQLAHRAVHAEQQGGRGRRGDAERRSGGRRHGADDATGRPPADPARRAASGGGRVPEPPTEGGR